MVVAEVEMLLAVVEVAPQMVAAVEQHSHHTGLHLEQHPVQLAYLE